MNHVSSKRRKNNDINSLPKSNSSYRSGLQSLSLRPRKSSLRKKKKSRNTPKLNICWSPKVKQIERVGTHTPKKMKDLTGRVKWSILEKTRSCTGYMNAKWKHTHCNHLKVTIDDLNRKPILQFIANMETKRIEKLRDAHVNCIYNEYSSKTCYLNLSFSTVCWTKDDEKVRTVNTRGFNVAWLMKKHKFPCDIINYNKIHSSKKH
jgi:hypothetical protein